MSEHQLFSRMPLLLLVSRVFERAGYYGFRSIILLYFTSDLFNYSRIEVLEKYGLLTSNIFN